MSETTPQTGAHQAPQLSQQEREEFWTRRGWRAGLPLAQRKEIEERFSDEEIQEATFHGF